VNRLVAVASAVSLVAALALPAVALARPPFPHTIVLPGAHSAEGIATSHGSTFYAGELFTGDIFRGDLRTGAVARFIDAPEGRNALGIRVDEEHNLLFVAGGFTGQGYVYDLTTGAPIASYQFGTPPGSIINDVIVAGGSAWFTDSVQPHLYRVPILGDGAVGDFETLTVTGPAGALTGGFNMNGIAASPDGETLIVAHSSNGALYTVDPATGASAQIEGADVPNVDGILVQGHRLWAVRNTDNEIDEFRLSGDLSSATLVQRITDPAFQVPTTVARWGHRLATVNAKFDTGFPPTATTFEVVEVIR
jgi:sugar lactone lactonase YvrE